MARYIFVVFALMATMLPAADRRKFSAHAQADEYLSPHNVARSEVGVGPLTRDSGLEAYARSYAESQTARNCTPLQHSRGPYGENLYWSSRATARPGDAVAAWVGEKVLYDYPSNSCAAGEQCGHYTQVVWRATTTVGCASVGCNGGTYIICSYNPPGNVVGQQPY